MAQGQLLIPYGARGAELLHIDEVHRGLMCACSCPACGGLLIARKGPKRVHHFAHQSDTECSPETVAHSIGKRLPRERITKAIESKNPVELSWDCETCGDTHRSNLLERASRIEEEYHLGICRPDLVLLGPSSQPIALLEIVVSHKPEDHVRAFASNRRIPLFEFAITTGQDLRLLSSADPISAHSDRCLRPKCPKCRQPMYEKYLEIVATTCWKCSKPMKAARIVMDHVLMDPDYFTSEERQLAMQNGVLLKRQYSKTVLDTYLANTCPSCSAFIGRNYIYEAYEDVGMVVRSNVGFGCPNC